MATANAVPPKGSKCQEAHASSREDYIPCGKPATCIVVHKGKASERAGYLMCAACGDHNVKNRGASYIKKGESYTPFIATPTEPKAKRESPPPKGDNSKNAIEDEEVEEAPAATNAQIKQVTTLAQRQKDLLAEIEALEADLAKKYELLKVNKETDLPRAMSECSMESFTLKGGGDVELKKVLRAAIPAKFAKQGIEYMMKTAPDLVKHKIEIEFGMDDAKFFAKFMRDLGQRKKPVDAKSKDYVHPGTLGKFVRECDAAGRNVPEEILGVFRSTIAEVKLPKGDADAI